MRALGAHWSNSSYLHRVLGTQLAFIHLSWVLDGNFGLRLVQLHAGLDSSYPWVYLCINASMA